jgi:quinol-cytochrome oxidoreductase complex cytochrome b subunit
MDDEKKKLRINRWAVFYFLIALLYLALFYTEITGIWVTVEGQSETPAPSVEPEKEEVPNG